MECCADNLAHLATISPSKASALDTALDCTDDRDLLPTI